LGNALGDAAGDALRHQIKKGHTASYLLYIRCDKYDSGTKIFRNLTSTFSTNENEAKLCISAPNMKIGIGVMCSAPMPLATT
jgi:hypothetical protein